MSLDIREVAEFLRRSGARVEAVGERYVKFHALHRGDRHASLSCYQTREGGFRVKDFATGEGWSLRYYLLEVVGLPREEVEGFLGERWRPWTPVPKKPKPKEPPFPYAPPPSLPLPLREVRRTLKSLAKEDAGGLVRGLPQGFRHKVGLVALRDGRILFPAKVYLGGEWLPANLKVRNPEGEVPRYRYLFPGNSGYGVVWRGWDRPILLVEGEINAFSLGYTLEDYTVVGIPGASYGLTEELAQAIARSGREVYLTGDKDEPGLKLLERIREGLILAGTPKEKIRLLLLPGEGDANEILVAGGKEALAKGFRLALAKH